MDSFGAASPPPPPQSSTVVTERVIVAPARRGWLSVVFGLLFVLFVVLPGLFVMLIVVAAIATMGAEDKVTEQYHSLSRTATDKIAIITVEGAIYEDEGFVKKQIDHVRDDKHVKAVVLRINSPGGTVSASDYLYHHLRELTKERRIPLVVSMGGIAASGGYYMAMAVGDREQTIFAEPTTWTGSIGVIIPHYNVAGLMKKWQIEEDSIKSGAYKQMGSITRPMTEEERKIFEHLVADSFARFKQVIMEGRPAFAADPAALDKVATGRVFTTNEAIDSGLVDRVGFVEQAIERAAQLAGLSTDDVKVVKYKDVSVFKMPFSAQGSHQQDLTSLIDVASPRAYYLFTWLPLPVSAP